VPHDEGSLVMTISAAQPGRSQLPYLAAPVLLLVALLPLILTSGPSYGQPSPNRERTQATAASRGLIADARRLLFGRIGDRLRLRVTATDGADLRGLEFVSADREVATVGRDGGVTATGFGETRIIVETHRGRTVVPVQVARHWAAYTFDGGPNPRTVSRLLTGLKGRGVDATFFLRGDHLRGNEAIVRRMDHEGHEVGNQSWNHLVGDPNAVQEAQQTDEAIRAILGTTDPAVPALYRPPGGNLDGLVRAVPHPLILWNVAASDSHKDSHDSGLIYRRIMAKIARTGSGSIILNHDKHSPSVTAALHVIDTLTARGYAFVTASDLLSPTTPGRVYRHGRAAVRTMKIN